MEFTDKKILVVFFFHKGQNYVSGSIVELKIKNWMMKG